MLYFVEYVKTEKLGNFQKKPINAITFTLNVEAIYSQFILQHPPKTGTLNAQLHNLSIKWEAPSVHFIKVNTDGARDLNTSMAAIEVVIYDAHGHFIVARSVNIGVATIIIAELVAI